MAAISVKEDSKTVDASLNRIVFLPHLPGPHREVSGYFVSRGSRPPSCWIRTPGHSGIIGSRSYSESEVVGLFRELARR